MFDAELQADAARDGLAVIVFGTTALPDGTFIKYEVSGGGFSVGSRPWPPSDGPRGG